MQTTYGNPHNTQNTILFLIQLCQVYGIPWYTRYISIIITIIILYNYYLMLIPDIPYTWYTSMPGILAGINIK